MESSQNVLQPIADPYVYPLNSPKGQLTIRLYEGSNVSIVANYTFEGQQNASHHIDISNVWIRLQIGTVRFFQGQGRTMEIIKNFLDSSQTFPIEPYITDYIAQNDQIQHRLFGFVFGRKEFFYPLSIPGTMMSGVTLWLYGSGTVQAECHMVVQGGSDHQPFRHAHGLENNRIIFQPAAHLSVSLREAVEGGSSPLFLSQITSLRERLEYLSRAHLAVINGIKPELGLSPTRVTLEVDGNKAPAEAPNLDMITFNI